MEQRRMSSDGAGVGPDATAGGSVRRSEKGATLTRGAGGGRVPSGGAYRRFARWLYRGGRPNVLARAMNSFSAVLFGRLPLPESMARLDVVGRRSGAMITFPMVVADHEGERYLVSMLGDGTNWLRNVRAAGGRAVLRQRGRAESIILADVPPGECAPILRRYLRLAPGARPHIPVDMDAPLSEFEKIVPEIPVLRINACQRSVVPGQ